MLKSNHHIVPVVMFHSIGLENGDWCFSFLSEPVARFEDKVRALARAGYRFIFWKDLFDHMADRKRLPGKSIMLTFDDGYRDNWVYAFPILKKYGARATIFVSPDFVDPNDQVHATLDNVWAGKLPGDALRPAGFLSWEEMRLMEASGLVDIQSHALTHTWYFSGPAPVDFYRPGCADYPWLNWNRSPHRKPFYMKQDGNGGPPPGSPVYQHEKALVCRRYFPPENLAGALVDYVDKKGGERFFNGNGSWRDQLKTYHAGLLAGQGDQGHYETDEAYRQRVFRELSVSRATIEDRLSKRVRFICWPGGGYNDTVLALAREAGYMAWTLSSRDQSAFRNLPGAAPEQVKRISSFPRYRVKGREFGEAGALFFRAAVERHKGSLAHAVLGRLLKSNAVIRAGLKRIWPS